MTFREIFRFELAYQVRRPWPWLFFAVLLVLNFLMTRDAGLADALYEDFFVNSPFGIAKTTVFGTLIWLLLAAPVAGEAGARDVAARMYPLIYTARISKADYLGGRFLAAFVLNALILLGAQLGIVLAVYSPGVATAVIGPARPGGYLAAYGIIALPTAFAATAVQFGLAVRTGRAMAGYVGSLLMIFMGFFVASLLLFNQGWGSMLDPIGIRFIVEDMARLWTPVERNTRMIGLDGAVGQNRLFWVATGLMALAAFYWRFRFEHRTEGARLRWFGRWRGVGEKGELKEPAAGFEASTHQTVMRSARDVPQSAWSLATECRQTRAITWESFRTLTTSFTGLGTLIGIPLLTVLVVIDQMEAGGAQMIPTTPQVLRELTASVSNELSRWVIIPLVIVMFAGELVWREREAGIGEINDAMPGSEWPPLVGKFLGLGLVLTLLMLGLCAAGMFAQLALGYQQFEIGLYLKVMLGLQLPEYLLFALMALVAHVVIDEKYIGHLVAIMAYVFIAVLGSMLGIEHNLLVYGAGPGWTYTPMRGFGPDLAAWLWFKLYWAAWALLFLVGARLLWVRGKERGVGVRLRWARRRLTRTTAMIAITAALLVASLGGFIYYNTNVLNTYLTAAEITERRAEYERRYGKFEGIAQPEMTGTKLRVEIYPKRGAVQITGSYQLLNSSSVSIHSIHIAIPSGRADTRAITFDRPATLAVDDAERGYRIYDLGNSLEPGDSLEVSFDVSAMPRGFRENGVDGSVSATGSAIMNSILPAIGYQRSRALTSANDRREQNLPSRPVIASLYDVEGREPAARGGGVMFEAIVGTDADQMAVAPGGLRRTWTENGRRYFQYSTDAPIGSEWSFFSARYVVQEVEWKAPDSSGRTVAIRIFHDPKHTEHLGRMERSARASLDYYSQQFGAYPYGHLTFVEHPGAPGTGLHADAGMVSYGEGFPFWIPRDGGLDFPFAVVAHEMGHQWTLPYAFVEGAPFMSEGLAWYSAMQVVKASRGDAEFRRLMSTMRQPFPYAPIRRGEPLLRALDPYLSYRRGPFAMYALSEYIGVERVNGAIRQLIGKSELPGATRVTTLDLYRELTTVTPDSLKPLLHDLFEVNAYWLLDTERASAKQMADGSWRVTLDIRARKMVYDSAGVESELPMDDWVELGVFGTAAAGADEMSRPLYLQKHRIRTGTQTITVTVPSAPEQAGIDPRRLLIEGVTESRNSLIKVSR
ncbi:MAG: hypothetical protein H7Z40_15925 [Phycisphaerae bacterium]|nr:hypothetical protein [Gemmatimonadaceae bacterium]